MLSDLKNQLEAKREVMLSKTTNIQRIPKTNPNKSERISFTDGDASERSALCVPQRVPPLSFSLGDHQLEQRAVESPEKACEWHHHRASTRWVSFLAALPPADWLVVMVISLDLSSPAMQGRLDDLLGGITGNENMKASEFEAL